MPGQTAAGTPYLKPSDPPDQIPAVSQAIALGYDAIATSLTGRVSTVETTVAASAGSPARRLLTKTSMQACSTGMNTLTWQADTVAGDPASPTVPVSAAGVVTVPTPGLWLVAVAGVMPGVSGALAIRRNGTVAAKTQLAGTPLPGHLTIALACAANDTIDVVVSLASGTNIPAAAPTTETTSMTNNVSNRPTLSVVRLGS